MMKKLTKAKCCWTCIHSMFDRQSGASGSRYRGTCMESFDQVAPWPVTWTPPNAFYEDRDSGTFIEDFDEWLVEHGQRYYGDAIVLELGSGNGVFANLDRIKLEHTWMVEMLMRASSTQQVSFTDVCESYKPR